MEKMLLFLIGITWLVLVNNTVGCKSIDYNQVSELVTDKQTSKHEEVNVFVSTSTKKMRQNRPFSNAFDWSKKSEQNVTTNTSGIFGNFLSWIRG